MPSKRDHFLRGVTELGGSCVQIYIGKNKTVCMIYLQTEIKRGVAPPPVPQGSAIVC